MSPREEDLLKAYFKLVWWVGDGMPLTDQTETETFLFVRPCIMYCHWSCLKSPDNFLLRPGAASAERRGPFLAERSEGGEGDGGLCWVGRGDHSLSDWTVQG